MNSRLLTLKWLTITHFPGKTARRTVVKGKVRGERSIGVRRVPPHTGLRSAIEIAPRAPHSRMPGLFHR
jgi:hypothetical protein